MADKNLDLALRIRTDLQQSIKQLKALDAAIDGTGYAADKAGKSSRSAASGYAVMGSTARTQLKGTTGATREYDGALKSASASTLALNANTRTVGGGLTSLATSVKAVTLTLAAGFGFREIVQSTDAWTNYQNRLRLVTDSQAALTATSRDVYQIARETSQQLDSTAAVYQRFAQNADRLNITQRESAELTETVSKAIAISGSSAASSEAALVQFGQALASGVLRGEEYNSVSEQAYGLTKAIADGLDVDIGKLREMANAGELTADVLVEALSKSKDSVDQQFATRVKTIAQAATEFDVAFTRLLGTISSSQGAGEGLATVITGLADVMDGLSDNADVLGAALDVALVLGAGRVVAALTGLSAETIKNMAVNKAATVAAAQKALADEGVAVSAGRAALAELEKARAAVISAEADVAATRAEALRTAALAKNATTISGKAALEARAAAAAEAHRAAELRLIAALDARAVASGTVATTTAAVTTATAASTVAVGAAAAATSFLVRTITLATAAAGRILTLLGGPIGLVVSVGLAATAFLDFGDDAEKGMKNAAQQTENASIRIRTATRQMINDLQLGDIKTAGFDQLGQSIEQLEAQLQAAQATRDHVQTLNDGDVPNLDLPSLEDATEKVQALEAAIAKLKRERDSDRFAGVRQGDEYIEMLDKQRDRLENVTEREKALSFMRKNGIDAESEMGKKILERVDANDQLSASIDASTEAEREAIQAAEEARRAAEQRIGAQLNFVEQLERTVAVQALTTEEIRDYEIAEKGLTGTLLARARAANQAIAAQEALNQDMADARDLKGIEGRLLDLGGQPVQARTLQLEQQFGPLLERLRTRGDTAGVQMIEGLVNLELAQTRLGQLQGEIDRVLSEQSRVEASIRTQREAGLLTEIGARDQIVQLHRQTAAVLEQQRPLLAEMAAQPGAVGEAGRIALEQLNMEAERLNGTLTLLQSTLKEGLQQGLSDAIYGLANGTMTLRDAVITLVQSVSDSLLKLASDGLAEMMANNLMSVFSQGANTAAQAGTQAASSQVAAIGTVTAAKTAADTTMATSSITAANTAAAGQVPAAAATTAAWAPAATVASIGSFGTAAAIGLAAVLAALALSKAFKDGGHVTGPGTGTSDSISARLSNNEYVTRSAVVTQPGALPFLHDFNKRGMSALDDWAGRVRHATGGLAGIPAPAMASPSLSSSSLASGGSGADGQPIVLHLYNLIDKDEIADAAFSSSKADRHIVNKMRSNKKQVTQIVGSSKA